MKRREFLGSAAGLAVSSAAMKPARWGRFPFGPWLRFLSSFALPAGLFVGSAMTFGNIGTTGDWPGLVPMNSIGKVKNHGDDPLSGPVPMEFVEEAAKGTMTITDGGVPVLTYRFGDQLKAGIDPKFRRSCYVQPLYSLDGREMTADFPADHVHHHGIFWGWPVVKVRGVTTSNWEVGSPPLRQRFVRWRKREIVDGVAVLSVENSWKLGDSEVVAREIVTLRVHPAVPAGREIDLELLITAIGGPLALQGTPDQNKGYGGLCFRSSPLLKGARMTTDKGELKEDVVNTLFRWADISTDDLGVAIFVAPGHPNAPIHWLIRNSYAGVINPSWPGLKPATLLPDQPLELRYRIYIHRGNAAGGKAVEKFKLYENQDEGSFGRRLRR